MTEKEIHRLLKAVRKIRKEKTRDIGYEASCEKKFSFRDSAMAVKERIVKYGAIDGTRI